MRQAVNGQKKKIVLTEYKKRVRKTVYTEAIRNYRGDRNAICRLYPWCRRTCQLQIAGKQAGQYLLFQAAEPGRPENDRAGSALLKYQLYLAKSSINPPFRIEPVIPESKIRVTFYRESFSKIK
jgi:hypothetical protein